MTPYFAAPAKVRLIGVMLPFQMAYSRGMASGIGKYAHAAGNWTIETYTNIQQVKERGKRLDGLIMHWTGRSQESDDSGLVGQVVSVSNLTMDGGPPRVVSDDAMIGRQVAEHFLQRGFANLAYSGFDSHRYSKLRLQGFQERAGAAGVKVESKGALNDAAALRDWLKGLPKPVGLFACNDHRATQIIDACTAAGLRVPQDISLVGVDNDEVICCLAGCPISSVRPNCEKIGYEACALLDSLMDGATPPDAPTIIPPLGIVSRKSSELMLLHDDAVTLSLQVITENSHRPLNVAELADAVGLGRRSLERRFREVLGVTPYHEIQRARVERAKRLLETTDLTVEMLAQQTGFSEARFLNAAFRKFAGQSPAKYRQSHRLR